MNTNLLNIVKKIITDYGEAVLSDPQRLKAFFGDLAKDEPKPLRVAFGRCIEAGAYSALKTAPNQSERAGRKAAVAQRVRDEQGLDIALCAEALDILEAALFGVPSAIPPQAQAEYQQPSYSPTPIQPVYQQPKQTTPSRVKKNPLQYFLESFKKCVAFRGRARRAEYWWFGLIALLFQVIILSGKIYSIALAVIQVTMPWIITCLFSSFNPIVAIILLPGFALSIRRMHDCGKSGWYCLIPVYGSLIIPLREGDIGPNRFGPDPKQPSQQPPSAPLSQTPDDRGYR